MITRVFVLARYLDRVIYCEYNLISSFRYIDALSNHAQVNYTSPFIAIISMAGISTGRY